MKNVCELSELSRECVSDGYAEITYEWNYDYCGCSYTETVEDQTCGCEYTCWEDDECVSDGFMRQIRTETTDFEYCEDTQYQEVENPDCDCESEESGRICIDDGFSEVTYEWNYDYCGCSYTETVEDESCLCNYTEWEYDECVSDGYLRQTRTETSGYGYCTGDLERTIEYACCSCKYTEWKDNECIEDGIMRQVRTETSGHEYCDADLIREVQNEICNCISTETSRECVANVTALINYSWNYPYCLPDSEYVYDESCLICIPNWICIEYSECTSENYQYCTQIQDTNNCLECYEGDYSEFIKECNYCGIYGPKIITDDTITVMEGDLVEIEFEIIDSDSTQFTYSISSPVGNDKKWQTIIFL